MNTQDKRTFAEALIATGEVYGKEISAAMAEMFFLDLAEFAIGDVVSAMAEHRRDPHRGQFFPKPADLIAKLRIDPHEQALAVWPEVERLASNIELADGRCGDDVARIAVNQMGGWSRIGRATYRELPFLQKEFLERYESLTQTPKLLERVKLEQIGQRKNKVVSIGHDGA